MTSTMQPYIHIPILDLKCSGNEDATYFLNEKIGNVRSVFKYANQANLNICKLIFLFI